MSNRPRKLKNKLPQVIRDLRKKIRKSDLSYRQIYQALHISQGWFLRMIVGDFIEPNPVWMARINGYLDATIELKVEYN